MVGLALTGTVGAEGAVGIKIGRGKATVELDGELGRAVERCIRQFAPTLLGTLDVETKTLLDAGRDRWPVGKDRSGKESGRPHSKDLFTQGVRIVSTDRVEGFIDNSAPYVFKIKTAQNGVGGSGSPWVELVRKPVEAAADRLAETMGGELAALIDNGGR